MRGRLFALALIVAGLFLFLDNLGILPVENISAYWPLALVIYGLGVLYYKRSGPSIIFSGTLIAAGILLILGNLHILRLTFGTLWPLLLIAAGVLMLVSRPDWESGRAKWEEWHSKHGQKHWKTFDRSTFTGSRIDESAVFFSAKRQVEAQDFQYGELAAVFGSIEVNFREARIGGTPVKRAVLDASAVFGSIDIRVPRNWRVRKEGTGVFGSYEDKTVPVPNEPGVDPSILVMRGGAVFGSVTITN